MVMRESGRLTRTRAEGYETRFGVTYVDYENGQVRHPKKSAGVVGPFVEALIKKE